MNFTNTQVSNFENAFRGLRNPLESWNKSDSEFGIGSIEVCEADYEVAQRWEEKNYNYDFEIEYDNWYQKVEEYAEWLRNNGVLKYSDDCVVYAYLGPNDINLAHRMVLAGTSDSKFLRQINVSVDITAPLYWWKEMDQYKIGTVTNSTSTMHKLAATPITIDCFEIDDFNQNIADIDNHLQPLAIIQYCEEIRKKYLETKDKRYWKELIRWLPEGWLQTRTWTGNYAVLRNIYFQRCHHKLTEWRKFCDWIENLPYSKDLITYLI